jgi:hypothetical protein
MGVQFCRGPDDIGIEVLTYIETDAVEDIVALLTRQDEDVDRSCARGKWLRGLGGLNSLRFVTWYARNHEDVIWHLNHVIMFSIWHDLV